MNCSRLLICIACCAKCAVAADLTNHHHLEGTIPHSTKAPNDSLRLYQKEVLQQLLNEVNEVAQALELEERLPIVESNLVDKFITPANFAKRYGGLGSVRTEKYAYSAAGGNKLSFIIGRHQAEDCSSWEGTYLWPKARMDTNAAYLLAVDWLKRVSIDVEGLNRDHRLRIEPDKIYIRSQPDKFVPAYWVGWYKQSDPSKYYLSNSEWEPVASVFLFLPTKKLLQLRVEDPTYILRKPIQVTNAASFSPPKK